MTVLGLTGLWLAWRSRSWKASFVTVGMWGLAWVPKASWGVGLVACGAFVLGLLLIGGNRDQIYGFRKIWGVAGVLIAAWLFWFLGQPSIATWVWALVWLPIFPLHVHIQEWVVRVPNHFGSWFVVAAGMLLATQVMPFKLSLGWLLFGAMYFGLLAVAQSDSRRFLASLWLCWLQFALAGLVTHTWVMWGTCALLIGAQEISIACRTMQIADFDRRAWRGLPLMILAAIAVSPLWPMSHWQVPESAMSFWVTWLGLCLSVWSVLRLMAVDVGSTIWPERAEEPDLEI